MATASKPGPSQKEEEKEKDDKTFECNICLDTAKDAVVSLCGHLFCEYTNGYTLMKIHPGVPHTLHNYLKIDLKSAHHWLDKNAITKTLLQSDDCGHSEKFNSSWPCLHQWLETRPNKQMCPVCKAAISKEKVIPLYGRGSTNQEDPRNKVPPRPAGQRTEPESNGTFPGFGFGDGNFHMSFGIGAFPFAFFTSSLNFGEHRPSVSPRGTPQYDEEQFLSKVFLWVAFIFLFWLLMA